jgi:hypothetical protein
MQDVTGPISINLSNRARNSADSPIAASQRGYLKNITFSNIRASVMAEGGQYPDIAFQQNYRPGETRQCIVLNAIGDSHMEEIVFSDVQVTYGGGGTAEEASREVPQVAGEYFEIGTPPAYGLYARNVRGLTLNNVRLDFVNPDLRPAVVLDHVSDGMFAGLSARGNPQAMATLRCIESRDILLTAPRLLSAAAAFLRIEGTASEAITVNGGDISKANAPAVFESGSRKESVKMRG